MTDEERARALWNYLVHDNNPVLISRYGKPSENELLPILAAFAAIREEGAKERERRS
jgi:hypothetical protein